MAAGGSSFSAHLSSSVNSWASLETTEVSSATTFSPWYSCQAVDRLPPGYEPTQLFTQLVALLAQSSGDIGLRVLSKILSASASFLMPAIGWTANNRSSSGSPSSSSRCQTSPRTEATHTERVARSLAQQR